MFVGYCKFYGRFISHFICLGFFWLLVFQVFQFKCPSALNCCTFLSESEAAGGTEDGTLWLIDIRFPRLVSFNTGQQRTRLFIFLGVQKKYFIQQNSSSRCCETFCRRGLSCIVLNSKVCYNMLWKNQTFRGCPFFLSGLKATVTSEDEGAALLLNL